MFVCQLASYSLLLASQVPRKQWFESFLKLLLSLKCSHLSSLLISPALQWVRETLNYTLSSSEYNIALLCAWVIVWFVWSENKACNPGFPHLAHHAQRHHKHCSKYGSRSMPHLIVWLHSKLSHAISVWVGCDNNMEKDFLVCWSKIMSICSVL